LKNNQLVFFRKKAYYLAPDVEKPSYDLFVEDIEAITDNSDLCDVILAFGDFFFAENQKES
jgi:hypothetical protein